MARMYNVTFAARNPPELARFWSAVMHAEVIESDAERARVRRAATGMLFLRVDEPAADSAVHLDLAADDPRAEVERLLALGATAVDRGGDGEIGTRTANGITWWVLADPEGNQFCVGGEP